MSEGLGQVESKPLSPPVARSPERLLGEAFSLAAILIVVLTLSTLEQKGFIPWAGYPSSLAFLLLGMWHRWKFGIQVRLWSANTKGWAFPLIFAMVLVAALLFAAWAPFWPPPGSEPPFFQGLHLLFLVPLSEEFYFRGLLLDHLRRGFSALPAIVMCSLLFALLHLPSGGMVEAGLLSLAACVLVLKGGALGYALQLHIAWNGFVEVNRMGPASARWFWAGFAASLIVALVLARFRKGGQAPSSVHF